MESALGIKGPTVSGGRPLTRVGKRARQALAAPPASAARLACAKSGRLRLAKASSHRVRTPCECSTMLWTTSAGTLWPSRPTILAHILAAWSPMRSRARAAWERVRASAGRAGGLGGADGELGGEAGLLQEGVHLLADHPEQAVELVVAAAHLGGHAGVARLEGLDGVVVHEAGDALHAREGLAEVHVGDADEVLQRHGLGALLEDLDADEGAADVAHGLAGLGVHA